MSHRPTFVLVTKLFTGFVALAAAGCALLPSSAGAEPNQAVPTHAPIGHVDSITAVQGGVHVIGWAADPDTPRSSIVVKGEGDVAQRYQDGIAHNPRPDVAAAHPELGPNHGFDLYLQDFGPSADPMLVCLSAQDLSGQSARLGCHTVQVLADRPAVGHLDSVRPVGNDHIAISGWLIDQRRPGLSATVDLMLGSSRHSYAFNEVHVVANQPRPDVARVYPGAGPNHGFTLTIAAKPGNYPVCAFVVGGYWWDRDLINCLQVTV